MPQMLAWSHDSTSSMREELRIIPAMIMMLHKVTFATEFEVAAVRMMFHSSWKQQHPMQSCTEGAHVLMLLSWSLVCDLLLLCEEKNCPTVNY